MESLRLWDISPTISAAVPVWPADTPFEAEGNLDDTPLRAILREPALKDTA